MTRYAGGIAAAFVVCLVIGVEEAGAYGAAAIAIAVLILDGGYRIALARGPRSATPARLALDRVVRIQCAATVGAGALVWAVGAALGADLLEPPVVIRAVLVVATVAVVTVFVSSLIDWFWILPRVGGIVRRAPCEEAGGQRWARVTGVWQFHRSVATLVVSGCVTGVVAYMGQTSDHDAKTAWFVVAAVIAAMTLAFNSASLRLLFAAFNPRQHVGDIIDIHGRNVYVVDVSLQGAKYKRLDTRSPPEPATTDEADPAPGRPFGDKEDGSLSLDDLGRYPKAEGCPSPCAVRCTAINAYCRHNPAAYD